MAGKKRNEVVAGLFVTGCLALALGVVLWLGAGSLLNRPAARAVFYVPESAGSLGLKAGNFVQINDEVVGRIADIRVQPDLARTLYLVDLTDDELAVHADGKAIVASGLVGDKQLVITSRGTGEKPLADEDHPVAIAGGFDQAIADITSAAGAMKDISEILGKELSPDVADSLLVRTRSVVASLDTAAADIATITGQLRPEMDAADPNSMLGGFKRTAVAAASAAETIDAYAKTDVADILASLREANTEILKITRDFSVVSKTAREVVTLNRANIDEIIDNFTRVSANLRTTSADLRRNPWKLMHKPTPGETHSQNIAEAARSFSEGAEQLDQTIAKLRALPEDVRSDDPQLQAIRQQIQDTFSNFSVAEQALWKELAQ